MITYSLTVYGIPKPRGSKTTKVARNKDGSVRFAGNRPVTWTYDQSKLSRAWITQIQSDAKDFGRPPLTGPLRLTLRFFLPRPKAHHVASDKSRPLKTAYELAKHTIRPDRLKLARAVEDALTGVLWLDDAQTVDGPVSKSWVEPGGLPRVEITIEQLTVGGTQ